MKLFEVSIKENEDQDFEVTFDRENFRTTKTFDAQEDDFDNSTDIRDWLLGLVAESLPRISKVLIKL